MLPRRWRLQDGSPTYAAQAPPWSPRGTRRCWTAALRFYLRAMLRSREAREYLDSRGIAFDTACRLGLGYAPGDGLRQYLGAAGFGGERMWASGLLTERGERFAGMVVVPDLSWGRVRWLVGRAIEPNVTPRFQALPGPRPPVLGLGWIDQAPPWVVVAEGLFDWLALMQWGLPALAALGTQGLERREAAERLAGLLGRRAAVVGLPHGVTDVAELAAHPQGRAFFLRLLAREARSVR